MNTISSRAWLVAVFGLLFTPHARSYDVNICLRSLVVNNKVHTLRVEHRRKWRLHRSLCPLFRPQDVSRTAYRFNTLLLSANSQRSNNGPDTVNKTAERQDIFGNFKVGLSFNPIARAWKAASRFAGNIGQNVSSEVVKLGKQSIGRFSEAGSAPFEPFAFLRRLHIPGSGSIAHFLNTPPSFNVNIPQVNLPPRAAMLNWTGQPFRVIQSTFENWRRQGTIGSQRRGKVVVRSSRELAALLEQVLVC